jgi:hypothetical protein
MQQIDEQMTAIVQFTTTNQPPSPTK